MHRGCSEGRNGWWLQQQKRFLLFFFTKETDMTKESNNWSLKLDDNDGGSPNWEHWI